MVDIHKIKAFIEATKNIRVAVVGETITDEFVDVSYEGQSMKSTCPVYKLEGNKSVQHGGANAIANHLKDFVKSVELISNRNNEITKTRYIDVTDRKKYVEINKFDTSNFKEIKVKTNDYDIVIVADFGHGFCDRLLINDGFHLMSQTNSNNFGFNRISKWKKHKKKSVCLDLREASLQINRKIISPTEKDVKEIFDYELNTDNLFITTGKKGSIYSDGMTIKRMPSFKSTIVDTLGAGDTFFAFSCLATHIKSKIDNVLLIPSLAASLSTTWLCNEKSVTKKALLEHAARYI